MHDPEFPGTALGEASSPQVMSEAAATHRAVTIAIAKKKGSNAVHVANAVLTEAESLRQTIVPRNMELVVTRNYGLTADEKVNELVEALAVAIIIVVALLTLSLGWREAFIVAVAVPVVFGLTLAVNLLLGFTINRVTLFALILALGLLVDDPIVDVENIARHFFNRKKATRRIVLEAVAEIRPPLITATLAVIVSFLPMFFITGMMGPYMRPMALNVPVTMLMSMLVAFTITPWLAYHMLKRKYATGMPVEHHHDDPHDLDAIKQSRLYRLFYPLMAPLLKSRLRAWVFLLVIGLLTVAAMMLAATRAVPLKMLPFDNKNELLLVLDFDEGTTLERSDAAVRDFERYLACVPEVSDYTSYVGTASPMDFNGMVRHYYLRRGDNVAELRINMAGKKNRHTCERLQICH
jgi:multidrug efflux pump subunit AcrB